MTEVDRRNGIPNRATVRERLLAAFVVSACAALLSIARTLTPSPTGVGTHTQLGLPPDPILEATGVPLPTCGMTTSFAWFVRGRLFASLYVEPMGALLAAATTAALPVGLFIAVTGRPVHRRLAPLLRPRTVVTLGVLAVLSWGWKVLIHLKGLDGWN